MDSPLTLNAEEVAQAAILQGVDPYWGGRIREMADWGRTITGHPYRDRTVVEYVKVEAHPQWPHRKGVTIRLTREDGARVTLRCGRAKGFWYTVSTVA